MPAAANLLRRAAALLPAYRPGAARPAGRPRRGADGRRRVRRGRGGPAAGDRRRQRAPATTASGRMRRSVLALVEFYADPPPDWSQRADRIATRRHPGVRAHRRRRRPGQGVARPRRRPRDGASLRPGGPAVARATAHARAAGDLRQERRNASSFAVAAVYGPTPVPRRSRSARASWPTRPATAAPRASCSAPSPTSRRCAASSTARASARSTARSTLEELGNSVLAVSTSLEAGAVELLAGNPAEAERLIRSDVAELERMGATYLLSDHDRAPRAGRGGAGPRRRGRRARRGGPAADGRGRRRVGGAPRVRALRPARPRRRRSRRDRRGPAGDRAPGRRRRAGQPDAEALLALAEACEAAATTQSGGGARTSRGECRAKGYLVAVERAAAAAAARGASDRWSTRGRRSRRRPSS